MIDRLPYTLTTGIVATHGWLAIEWGNPISQFFPGAIKITGDNRTWAWASRWPDAAERLRYREGEPWCQLMNGQPYVGGSQYDPFSDLPTLHRLSAILCDDSEAFRVLHWCVTELAEARDV